MGNVSVSLLGGFAAAVDGVPVPDAAWRLKKARELVKLLALAPGHRLHREQAMDVLWRDREPASAANNLHQAVFVARRALDAGAIEVRDESLRLIADVDVDRLELVAADARRAGTRASYHAALSIYQGELLPENRYDDWAEVRRDELAELAAELSDGAATGSVRDEAPRSLPVDASSFVGRDRELAELKVLLGRTRVLTLTGTGGVGKTRLALELARAAASAYSGGAVLVELAALSDARLVSGIRGVAKPIADLLGPMPYHAMQTLLDPLWERGTNAYFKATNLARLDDDLVGQLLEMQLAAPGPQCEIHLHQMGGAVGRVADGATAFAERSMPFVLNAVTGWHDPDVGTGHREWARATIAATSEASTGRAYVNFLGDADTARTSYGEEKYTRLVSLKSVYDPTNVFRLNHNIEPLAVGS